MTLEQQIQQLEIRVKKLERIEEDRNKEIQAQSDFENKRDEIMNGIGHDM